MELSEWALAPWAGRSGGGCSSAEARVEATAGTPPPWPEGNADCSHWWQRNQYQLLLLKYPVHRTDLHRVQFGWGGSPRYYNVGSQLGRSPLKGHPVMETMASERHKSTQRRTTAEFIQHRCGPSRVTSKGWAPALFWIFFIHRKLPAQVAQIPPLPR